MAVEKNMTDTPAAIEARGLTKSFGNHRALRGLDFKIMAGESVVVFGPNGAGKTTLIKVLATIMNPSSGNILIDGINTKDNSEELRRRIGVITHQTFLYNTLTAYENLEFYCRLYDVPEPGKRIKEVADLVGMTSRLHDRVGTLSRGTQQRFSIARSLLHRPSIMLLDEPETGLDQQAIEILREAMLGGDGVKRTVVLTTHHLERGLDFGSRVLILVQGQLAYEMLTESLSLTDLREAYYGCTGVAV